MYPKRSFQSFARFTLVIHVPLPFSRSKLTPLNSGVTRGGRGAAAPADTFQGVTPDSNYYFCVAELRKNTE